MKLKDVMTKNVQSCRPDTTLGEAALMMWQGDCGIVPVVDEANKVVGVITDRDICMGLATTGKHPYERTVREVMTGKAFTVSVDARIEDALEIMRRERVRRLPVVDAEGVLGGMVSLNDFVEHVELATGRGELRAYAPQLLHTMKAICTHCEPEGAIPKRSRKEAQLVP